MRSDRVEYSTAVHDTPRNHETRRFTIKRFLRGQKDSHMRRTDSRSICTTASRIVSCATDP